MKRIHHSIRMILIVSTVAVVMGFLSCAQSQFQGPPDGEVVDVTEKHADLAIKVIRATCVCEEETSKLDAILLSDLEVDVANHGSNIAADGIVTVTFRDLTTAGIRTESASFSQLNQGEVRTVLIFGNPLLIDAGVKVRAEVEPIGSVDPNLANNVEETDFSICHPVV